LIDDGLLEDFSPVRILSAPGFLLRDQA